MSAKPVCIFCQGSGAVFHGDTYDVHEVECPLCKGVPSPPQLHARRYPAEGGKLVENLSPDNLYVWCPVNLNTGFVDISDPQPYEDELDSLIDGWGWMKFYLTINPLEKP